MSRVNWKALRAQIPHFTMIGKTRYEIIWVDDFKDGNTLGETRFNPPQIALKNGQSDKETVKTYLHEVTHAVSEEEGANLTEAQVLSIERSLPYILKPGNLLTSTAKSTKKRRI